MFSNSLLMGTGISGLSTTLYAAFTNDKYERVDRKNEYMTIFCITLFISFLTLFIFNSGSDSLVTSNINRSPVMGGGKPPF